MTTDKIRVRILIYNDCGTEKFLNVFFPVKKFWRAQVLLFWSQKSEIKPVINMSKMSHHTITSDVTVLYTVMIRLSGHVCSRSILPD